MKPELSIVIPVKNEEKHISRILNSYGSFFIAKKQEKNVEIIVVIYDSKDKTSLIVEEYAKNYPFVTKLETPYASGKGGAVSMGFSKATGDIVGFVDPNHSIGPSEISKLYELLRDSTWLDGVVGKRIFSSDRKGTFRKILNNIFNQYVNLELGIDYSDILCGVKFFKKEAAKRLSKKLYINRESFNINLLLASKHLNYKLLEVPLKWRHTAGPRVGPISILIDILRLNTLNNKFINKSAKILKKKPLKKKVKNILIFSWRDIKNPSWGGAEVYVHEISKKLLKNHNVTLFTSKPRNLSSVDDIDGVHVYRRGNFVTVYFWAFIYYFLKFRKETDLIIDVENGIPFFTPLYSRKPKVMFLFHVHKMQWFKQFIYPIAVVGYLLELILMPILYRKINTVTISLSSMKDLVKLKFKPSNIFLAYPAIGKRHFTKVRKSVSPLVSYVGRVKAYKQVDIALRVVARLKRSFPGIKFIVMGSGEHLVELEKLVKDLNLENNVKLVGHLPDRKKWEVLQKSWAFLMPSMKEGWGITIIEAATCGTPSIGFDVPGVRDSICHLKTGFIAKNDNEFFKYSSILIKDKSVRKALGHNCKIWADQFSWSATAKIVEKAIKASITKKGILEDKAYPWELERVFSQDRLTTLSSIK